MDQRDVNLTLRTHRRQWWWPRHCRCGAPYPCGSRYIAVAAGEDLAVARARFAAPPPLADGDTRTVAGHARYADLLRPAPVRAIGRAAVPPPRPPRPAVPPGPLVRPYLDGRPGQVRP